MLLRATVLHRLLPCCHQDYDCRRYRLADLLPLRYLLPGVAPVVQLDLLRADNQLPGYVCLQQCDRYRPRYYYSLPAGLFYPEAADES